MDQVVPGPNAKIAGHAAVGIAAAKILHEIIQPKTLGAFLAWVATTFGAMWAHARFDLPVAKLFAAVAPEIG
jgi:hypothetical protein